MPTAKYDLSYIAKEIFDATMDAIQAAEEASGPYGQDYINLMSSIAAECSNRAVVYYGILLEEKG